VISVLLHGLIKKSVKDQLISSSRRCMAVFMLSAALLGGCVHTEQASLLSDPAQQARIRVFHGPSVYLYLGDVCGGNARLFIHAAAGGFSFFSKNKKIGIPPTEDMPWSYHEYAIPADQPVTVRMYWQSQKADGMWESCGPFYSTFTPKAGHDYDTFLKLHGGWCDGIELRELIAGADSQATTRKVLPDRQSYRSCRSWE
jgi:hypothetical protein